MRGLKSCVFESRTTAGRFNFSTHSRSERRVFRSAQYWQSTMPASMDYHHSAQRTSGVQVLAKQREFDAQMVRVSSTSRKCRTLPASLSAAHSSTTSNSRGGQRRASGRGRGAAIPFNTDFLGSSLYLGQIWDKPTGGYKRCWNQRLKESW